jgi:hypothetical protein
MVKPSASPIAALLAACMVGVLPVTLHAEPSPAQAPLAAAAPAEAPLTEAEAVEIATDAYIYGYSLITTEVTRVQMSNVAQQEGEHAPVNTFLNIRRYPPGDYRGVSAPNADTLYSLAWVDVGAEPIVFTHPDMGKRYFLFPMYSLWMPVVDSPGSRTSGEGAGTFLITGPGWQGQVPDGMKQIKSPTRYMVILGRTYADGTDADYAAVNALQDQYRLVPLSSFGRPYTYVAPPVDPNPGFSMKDAPQKVIHGFDSTRYFNMMARLMGTSAPPAAEDAPIVARMARIGIVPGKPFDPSRLQAVVQAALSGASAAAEDRILAKKQSMGVKVNGWQITGAAGRYGTDYLGRAAIAAYGWPANLPEDATYPTALEDGDGNAMSGENKYTLTFKKGLTPPVDGFWSITMYFDDGGWWFVPNALSKFTVSMRDNPVFNPDGTLTLYFQHESPGKDKEANWLPAPEGNFLLTMRMYWPRKMPPSILPPGKGTWVPPPVVKVN